MRSPTDDGVDRPDLDAPQGVKATGTNRPKQTHTLLFECGNNKHNKDTIIHTVACVHYTVSDTTHPTRHKDASSVCRWPIAAGKRPDPFRTRKLSLLTLMVLQPGGCGRVRNRRHQTKQQLNTQQRETVETLLFQRSLSFRFAVFTVPHNPKVQTRKCRPAGRSQVQARVC